MGPELHPDVTVLAPLLGTWEGSGTGEYPTIDDFAYLESITFAHVGKPFVAYSQRTRHPDTSAPMHAETGYLRVPRPGSIEIVMAQPTGLAEIYEGAVVGGDAPLVIDVRSTSINATFRMAAVGQPLQHHLSATLHRVG
jgi:hypothetical protein